MRPVAFLKNLARKESLKSSFHNLFLYKLSFLYNLNLDGQQKRVKSSIKIEYICISRITYSTI